MIEHPDRHIEEFAKAGADNITFHAEATPHINRTLNAIRELGCLAGLAINPGTPVSAVSESVNDADVFLCMTVNPGWGGQPFIADSPDKVGGWPPSSAPGRSRSTAASTPSDRRRRRRPPERASSSPARRSSEPTIPPPPTRAIAEAAGAV